MIPATHELCIYGDDTFDEEWRLDGDYTGHVVKLQIRDGRNGPVIADLSAGVTKTLEPASGSTPTKTLFMLPQLSSANVLDIRAALEPRYDFELSAGTIKKTYVRGPVRFEQDVSR